MNLQDRSTCPSLEDIGAYINHPLFYKFCDKVKETYQAKESLEYSSCSWEPGWNVKFKKSGKSLCTIYPRELFFTVLIVVGKKEKEAVETQLPQCSSRLQEIYSQTKEGNGQRWLMIDLEDEDALYEEVFWLMKLRLGRK